MSVGGESVCGCVTRRGLIALCAPNVPIQRFTQHPSSPLVVPLSFCRGTGSQSLPGVWSALFCILDIGCSF